MIKIKKYFVYKHKFPNGKVYIGITCQNPKYRWNNGKGYTKSQIKMYNAIKKYGWENVEHSILYKNLTKEEAEEKEKDLIAFYKSYNDEFGYNIEMGGNLNKEISEETRKKMIKNHKGKTGIKLSEEQKKQIGINSKKRWDSMTLEQKEYYSTILRTVNIGRSSWNKGLHFNEKVRKKMSVAQKRKYENGYIHPMKGKKLTNEHKTKLSISHKGKIVSEKTKEKMKISNANAKKIIILETKEVYDSGQQLAKKLGCHRSRPASVCNGRTKTCRGYHLMWLEDYKEIHKPLVL